MEASWLLNSCIVCMNVIIKMQCKLQTYKIIQITMDDRPYTQQFAIIWCLHFITQENFDIWLCVCFAFLTIFNKLKYKPICAHVANTSHLMLITRVDNSNLNLYWIIVLFSPPSTIYISWNAYNYWNIKSCFSHLSLFWKIHLDHQFIIMHIVNYNNHH